MKGGQDRIDRLLDKNATEQLAKVDWDRLTDDISARLDHARRTEPMPSRRPVVVKIAARAAAAAAVIFVIIAFRIRESSDMRVHRGSPAAEVVDKKGAVSFQIKDASGRVLAMVQDGRTDKGAVKCDVEIIDRNGDLGADSSRAAWIIISAPKRTFVDNGYNREEADLMCLL